MCSRRWRRAKSLREGTDSPGLASRKSSATSLYETGAKAPGNPAVVRAAKVRSKSSPNDVSPGRWRKAMTWAWVRSRSEEHTSELQSLMRISYAVFCLKKKKKKKKDIHMNKIIRNNE